MKKQPESEQNANKEQDQFLSIAGIGPTFATALQTIGIRRLSDLAQSTPEELAAALLQHANVKISPDRIRSNRWIEQAGSLAQMADSVSAEPAHPGPETTPIKRQQRAGFSLFFDNLVDENSVDQRESEHWQIRIYHDESGQEATFEKTELAGWTQWILERTGLLEQQEVDEQAPSRSEHLPGLQDAHIEILEVTVQEIPGPVDAQDKTVETTVAFQLSGEQAPLLTEQRIPFRIELHTVDLEDHSSQMVASEQGKLLPGELSYRRAQQFHVPGLGNYELHSVVHLCPPCELMVYHRGPVIKVVP